MLHEIKAVKVKCCLKDESEKVFATDDESESGIGEHNEERI
jgi:hypothetical protein